MLTKANLSTEGFAKYADCKLILDNGEELPIIRGIVANASPYFDDVFSQNDDRVINCSFARAEVIVAIINQIYGHRCTKLFDTKFDLDCVICKAFMGMDVVEDTERYLGNVTKITACINAFAEASMLNNTDLLTIIRKKMAGYNPISLDTYYPDLTPKAREMISQRTVITHQIKNFYIHLFVGDVEINCIDLSTIVCRDELRNIGTMDSGYLYSIAQKPYPGCGKDITIINPYTGEIIRQMYPFSHYVISTNYCASCGKDSDDIYILPLCKIEKGTPKHISLNVRNRLKDEVAIAKITHLEIIDDICRLLIAGQTYLIDCNSGDFQRDLSTTSLTVHINDNNFTLEGATVKYKDMELTDDRLNGLQQLYYLIHRFHTIVLGIKDNVIFLFVCSDHIRIHVFEGVNYGIYNSVDKVFVYRFDKQNMTNYIDLNKFCYCDL